MSEHNKINKQDRVRFEDYKGAFNSIQDIYTKYPKGYYGWWAYIDPAGETPAVNTRYFVYWSSINNAWQSMFDLLDIEERLRIVNERLDTVNERLDTVNERLDTVNERLSAIDEINGFNLGCQTVDTVSGIIPMGTTTATISAGEALSFAETERFKPGYVASIRVRNTSAGIVFVTLPQTAEYEVDKWYQAAVYPGMVTEIIVRCIAPGKYAITYIVNKKSEVVLSPPAATFDAAGNTM
ncbi:MAG: hypothetical protein LBR26_09900 [Prevotella sp.]|jgi:hypothetical protein|nr:hypothetical protein [Prevotella sp.]